MSCWALQAGCSVRIARGAAVWTALADHSFSPSPVPGQCSGWVGRSPSRLWRWPGGWRRVVLVVCHRQGREATLLELSLHGADGGVEQDVMRLGEHVSVAERGVGTAGQGACNSSEGPQQSTLYSIESHSMQSTKGRCRLPCIILGKMTSDNVKLTQQYSGEGNRANAAKAPEIGTKRIPVMK